MGDHILSLPGGGDADSPAVRPHMVVFHRHFGGIVVKLVSPGIPDVDILGVAVSVKLPHGGHFDVIPAAVVETGFPEIDGTHVGIAHPIEFPYPVESQEIIGLLFHPLAGGILVFIREICRVHRKSVHFIDIRILPFLHRL